MPFRDDRDALRDRNETLEREVAELRARADEGDALRARVRELEGQLEKVLGRKKRKKRSRSSPEQEDVGSLAWFVRRPRVAVPALLALVGGTIGLVWLESSHPKPAKVRSTASSTARAPTPPAAPPRIEDEVRFAARVLEAEGRPVAKGQPCEIVAKLARAAGRADPDVVDVRVACGAEVLYRMSDPPGFGVTMLSTRAIEWPGPREGTYREELTLRDDGQRDGRPNAELATWSGRGRVHRDGLEPYSVELELDELSEPRSGEPLNALVLGRPDTAVYREVVRKRGRLVDTNDPSMKPGASCTYVVRPNWPHGVYDCRMRVSCDGRGIFGSGDLDGIASCAIAPGTPPTGDDAISLDEGKGRVTVETKSGLRWVVALDGGGTSPAGSASGQGKKKAR